MNILNDRDGRLKINDEFGNRIVYDKQSIYLDGKDPRMFGCVLSPGSPWKVLS
jgi:hypothetical protein